MSEHDKELREQLEHCRNMVHLGPGLIYRMNYDFVLQHGKTYPVTPFPFHEKIKQGVPKCCYGNAIALAAIHGYKYVEGFAIAPTIDMAFEHGWNEDENGNLIDNTWLNNGLAYMGIEFSVERADDATWNGDASVLGDYRRRWPLFRQPWNGEDYTIQWPPSTRLEMMREVAAGRLDKRILYARLEAEMEEA